MKGKKYTTKHILVSVGGRATVPNIPGKEHVITSDEALNLPERPNKICIVGGGYIALEFAGIFAGLGTEVHVFVRQPKVLRGFDEEVLRAAWLILSILLFFSNTICDDIDRRRNVSPILLAISNTRSGLWRMFLD